ncbi:MAG: Spi family protease inhibitor, partial [Muribaculaceae bacterium]|nr:Spi family protease inhibitor [Muribaculaceae bacterium]
MNKSKISALLLLTLALPAIARELTPEEALRRASSERPSMMAKGNAKATPKLAHTALTPKGAPAVYVFNNSNAGGYILLSADDVAAPLLGYSDHGAFTASEMPPQLSWWLSEYASQIEYAREKGLPAYSGRRHGARSEGREPIAPMVKTMWDQVEPFNAQCPLDG